MEGVPSAAKFVRFATEMPEVRVIPQEADRWATGQSRASEPSVWEYNHRHLLARLSLVHAEAEIEGKVVHTPVRREPTADEIFDMHYRNVECSLRRSGAIRGRKQPTYSGRKRPQSNARTHTFEHFLSGDQISYEGSHKSQSSVETHLSLPISIKLLLQRLRRRVEERIFGHKDTEMDK